MTTNPTSRKKAIRATRAVTFGGLAFVAACGTTPEGAGDVGADVEADTGTDTSSDATVDTAPDTPSDVEIDTPPDVEIDTPEPDVWPDTPPDPDVGSDTPPEPDVSPDVTVDVAPDVAIDIGLDVIATECSGEQEDGVCPAGCDQDDDVDCCYRDWGGPDWCDYSTEWGCQCAVEGPFAPPRFEATAP